MAKHSVLKGGKVRLSRFRTLYVSTGGRKYEVVIIATILVGLSKADPAVAREKAPEELVEIRAKEQELAEISATALNDATQSDWFIEQEVEVIANAT